MTVTPSKLRQNIYKLLDRVLKTGIPIEIRCKGHRLKIIRSKPKFKMDNLKRHDILQVDPEDIVHLDWTREWKPFI